MYHFIFVGKLGYKHSLLFRSQSMGISVFLEHLYYTDAATRLVKQVNKYTGGAPLNLKQTAKPPGAIKVVHPLNQPMTDYQSSFPG